ncbi:MAG TPA: hypothetical protein VF116_06970 [Ktedonobacterales bacterium]
MKTRTILVTARTPHRPHGVVLAALALAALLLASCAPSGGNPSGSRPVIQLATPTASGTPGASPSASATGTGTARASATPTSSASGTGGAGPYAFPLLPPGAALPSEQACADLIARSSWEPRPQNAAANARVPSASQLAGVHPWDGSIGVDPRADGFRQRITGSFTGTTDEILQWTACVWGVPVDVVRAEAVVESWWQQSQLGDWTSNQQYCPPGTWNGSGCYQSYGILQLKWYYFQGTFPMSRDDTAYAAETVYGIIRTCYEGWTTYLADRSPPPGYPAYHAGDLWGCIGRWYSGGWYDQGALDYIAKVKSALANKTWQSGGF